MLWNDVLQYASSLFDFMFNLAIRSYQGTQVTKLVNMLYLLTDNK